MEEDRYAIRRIVGSPSERPAVVGGTAGLQLARERPKIPREFANTPGSHPCKANCIASRRPYQWPHQAVLPPPSSLESGQSVLRFSDSLVYTCIEGQLTRIGRFPS